MELISVNLRNRFREAKNVFVLTGAGVSAESGVPTFRGGGNTAVWKGMPFDVISSATMLERNLAAVWEWFDYRRELLSRVRPNAAHETIARWQDRFAAFSLVTQNVDGLHRAAGSREVLELHGNITRARCVSCGVTVDLNGVESKKRPPSCADCKGAMRPDVVLFGEMLPEGVFSRAAERARHCDLCFVIGTSSLVYPAADLPLVAAESSAYLVEINPERTPLSRFCDEVIQGRAAEILPQLDS